MQHKALIPFILLFVVSCSNKTYQSINWQTSAIEIDGFSDEWKIPLKHYDSSLKLNYQISNDNKNLYFAVRIANELAVQKFSEGGLLFELDILDEGNDYPFSIKYPIVPEVPPNKQSNNEDGKTASIGNTYFEDNMDSPKEGNNRNLALLTNNDITIKGFNNNTDTTITMSMDSANGIFAKYYTNEQNILFYELSIPFKTFYKNEITVSDTLQAFRCKIGYIDRGGNLPVSQGDAGGMDARPSGGMGGPPPGGMGGPTSGQSGGIGALEQESANRSQASSFSKKVEQYFYLSYEKEE